MTDKGEATTIPDVKEQTAKADPTAGGFTIGLAANDPDSDETRFLLTPEVCGMLISSGLGVCMESEGGSSISYTDDNYAGYKGYIVTYRANGDNEYVLRKAPNTTFNGGTISDSMFNADNDIPTQGVLTGGKTPKQTNATTSDFFMQNLSLIHI